MTRDRMFKLVLVTVLVLVIGIPTAAAPPDDKLLIPNAGWLEAGSGSAIGGGISDTSKDSTVPAIAVTSDGTIYVAWSDASNENDEIYVKRWSGASWVELNGSASGGGVSSNGGSSASPTAAVAPDGTFYVAWSDDSGGNNEIYVRRWDGADWVEVGAGSASGGGISGTSGESAAPSSAVAPAGAPYVAWEEATGGENRDIYVKRWNDTVWEGVGGSATGGGISQNPGFSNDSSMGIASDGTVYVAWSDLTSGSSEIYVRQWDGAVWAEVGAGSASGGGISRVWGELVAFCFSPDLALTPDGKPYVGWETLGEGTDIRIRRWSGTAWEEVGSGSASGGGVSGIDQSKNPSLAVSPDGIPYVAWEYGGGSQDIYVRRWDGLAWTEVGVGSANAGGISDNGGASRVPAMVTSPAGRPFVAWADTSGGDSEIYVRRARAELEVFPTAFVLFAEIGGDDPSPQAINVKGIGGTINWTATVSPTVGWLSMVPDEGSTPTAATMTVTGSGLTVGQYTAQVVIDGGTEVADSPQIIDVKLIVAEHVYHAFFPLVSRNVSSQ